MSKLNMTQKIARIIGKKAGRNTFFDSNRYNPDNQCVYTEIKPSLRSISLGDVRFSDLKRICKARLQSFITKRVL